MLCAMRCSPKLCPTGHTEDLMLSYLVPTMAKLVEACDYLDWLKEQAHAP